jgi:hypothetical protein
MSTPYEENVLAVVRWCFANRYDIPGNPTQLPPAIAGYSRCVIEEARDRLASLRPLRPAVVRRAAPRPLRPQRHVVRQLARQTLKWLVSNGHSHARLCAITGVSRCDVSRIIQGKSVDTAAMEAIHRAIGGDAA